MAELNEERERQDAIKRARPWYFHPFTLIALTSFVLISAAFIDGDSAIKALVWPLIPVSIVGTIYALIYGDPSSDED